MRSTFVLLASAATALGQSFSRYTDPNGIPFWQGTFSTGVGSGSAQFGLALPPASATTINDEYIGHLVVPVPSGGTWMAMTHMSQMPDNLLLLTWLNGNKVMTDFRYATDYVTPDEYTGNAKLTVISSSVNSSYYEITYRCQHCWAWQQSGQPAGSQIPSTASGAGQIMGWAQATAPPTNPSQTNAAIVQHQQDGLFGIDIGSARASNYASFTTLGAGSGATTTAKPTSTSTSTQATSTSTKSSSAPSCTGSAASSLGSFDYIVVGGGAAGIPLASKLTNTGKKVLLIERGGPASARWGGTLKPSWLQGTNLSQWDVPGLCNSIYSNGQGLCQDYSVLAGCILGGGTSVNAGLWWKPHSKDFDAFPSGWKSSDMQGAISRAFTKIPFTEAPSADNQLYYVQGYQVLSNVFSKAGWKSVVAGNSPDSKTLNYGHAENMFSHGERGGPQATYLVDAMAKNNFKLIMNTMVDRVVRNGATASGVQVEGTYCGTISLNSGGKVILSAGAFGSPKILFRSGIGPTDSLNVVRAAEGSAMIDSSQWINLPVGMYLQDHAQTDVVVTQSSIVGYNFDNPSSGDTQQYLSRRVGVLAEAAPVFPFFAWHEVTGPDGITRQIQWQVRNGGSHGIGSSNALTFTQYIGRGATSHGRTTIESSLSMTVSQVPYYNDTNDLAVAKTSMNTMLAVLKGDSSIQVQYPSSGTSIDSFYSTYPTSTGARSGNHWVGSCRMGTSSSSAVVDSSLKVFGTNNIYVMDASIIPEICSANPSALIVSLAEKASEIL